MVMDGSPPAWISRLKIRHFEVLTTLVQTGSQSATAERLHVTQPALSKWLRELEQNMGCPLFTRGRPLRLTAYGDVVLRYAQRVLGDSARTVDELASLRSGSSGRVRVGALGPVAAIVLPKVIVRCRSELPDLQITVFEDTQDILLPRLQRHELDCVVGRLQPAALRAGIFSEALYEEPVHVVVRPRHPLLKRKKLVWHDLAEFPWILPLPETPMRQRVDAEFAASGLPSPRNAVESTSLLTNQRLLQQSDMVMAMSRQLAVHLRDSGSLAILPIRLDHALGAVGMLWVDELPSAALVRFMEAVRTISKALAADSNANGPGARRRTRSTR